MSLLIIPKTTLSSTTTEQRAAHDGIALTPPPPVSRHNSLRTRHPSIIRTYRRQDNDGRAKYSTYDPVYVRTYCTTRTQTAVIDLLGLSHAAHLVLIVIGRLLGGAVLRCPALLAG